MTLVDKQLPCDSLTDFRHPEMSTSHLYLVPSIVIANGPQVVLYDFLRQYNGSTMLGAMLVGNSTHLPVRDLDLEEEAVWPAFLLGGLGMLVAFTLIVVFVWLRANVRNNGNTDIEKQLPGPEQKSKRQRRPPAHGTSRDERPIYMGNNVPPIWVPVAHPAAPATRVALLAGVHHGPRDSS